MILSQQKLFFFLTGHDVAFLLFSVEAIFYILIWIGFVFQHDLRFTTKNAGNWLCFAFFVEKFVRILSYILWGGKFRSAS